MPEKVYSAAYIEGICEGRRLWKFLTASGELTLEAAQAELDATKRCLRQGFSGDMAEAFRGERDFWAQQVKKLSGGAQ
jgi:hypothetical protein